MTTNGFYFDPEQADLLIHVDKLKKRKMAIRILNENHLNNLKRKDNFLDGDLDNGDDAKSERRLNENFDFVARNFLGGEEASKTKRTSEPLVFGQIVSDSAGMNRCVCSGMI